MPKILNLRTAHRAMRSTPKTSASYWSDFKERWGKTLFDRSGRAYAPWQPNVKGFRYQKGRLVPRREP